MKTVTDNFILAQNKKVSFPITRLYMKRRYWDSGTSKYIWEATWTEIDRSLIQKIGTITQQLDTETLSEFRTSNVSIYLKNNDNVWQEWNTTDSVGKFAPVSGIPTNGFEPYLTKFQIKTGFKSVDQNDIREGETSGEGSEELIVRFTGVATDFQFDSNSQVVKITVEGLERLLSNGDAEKISTTVTLENIGTGDGIQKKFYTNYAGVGSISVVKSGATTLVKGKDYSISRLNDLNLGAQVELSEPSTDGATITCTYSYWKRNQLLETLIENIVDEAGITSKSISAATLGSINNNITLSSAALFDTGTHTGTKADKENGLMVDFNSNDKIEGVNTLSGAVTDSFNLKFTTENYSWSIKNDPVRGENALVGEDGLGGTSQARVLQAKKTGVIVTNYYSGFGEWAFELRTASAATCKIWLLAGNNTDRDAHDGYFIKLSDSIGLIFGRNEKGTTTEVSLATTADKLTAAFKNFTIRIDIEGNIKVYVDGVLSVDITDTTYTLGIRTLIDGTGDLSFKTVAYPNEAQAVYTSPAIDTQGGITAWGNVSLDCENTESLTIETRSSTDNINWDGWLATSGKAIQSAVKRYIQVKITFNAQSCTVTASGGVPPFPYVANVRASTEVMIKSITVEFTSTTVLVALADFSGMSCYTALQELAKLSDFEWGVDADEQFFFRTRTTSVTPDLVLSQDTNLVDISYIKYGYDNAYAIVRANFGRFVAEQASAAGSRTSALEIYGKRVLSLSSSVLINQDTNVADGIAAKFHTRVSVKRRQLEVNTIFLPQMELSDTVKVSFKHDAFSNTQQLLVDLVCKIVGVKHDPWDWKSTLTLEEIL